MATESIKSRYYHTPASHNPLLRPQLVLYVNFLCSTLLCSTLAYSTLLHCTLYSLPSTLHYLHSTRYSLLSTLCSLLSTVYSLLSTLYLKRDADHSRATQTTYHPYVPRTNIPSLVEDMPFSDDESMALTNHFCCKPATCKDSTAFSLRIGDFNNTFRTALPYAESLRTRTLCGQHRKRPKAPSDQQLYKIQWLFPSHCVHTH